MNASGLQDVDGPGKRGGHGRHEHRETAVIKLLDYERRDESFLDFRQRRLPRSIVILSGQPMRKAAKGGVAGETVEHAVLDAVPGRSPYPRLDQEPDGEANKDHQQQRQEILGGKPIGEQLCDWLYQSHQRLHCFEQQENHQIQRRDDKQPTDQCFQKEFANPHFAPRYRREHRPAAFDMPKRRPDSAHPRLPSGRMYVSRADYRHRYES
jgi:hypothetical protein